MPRTAYSPAPNATAGKAFPQHMFITAGDDTKKVFSLDMKLSRLSVNDNWDAKTELSSKYKEIGLEELMKQLLKSWNTG